MRVPVFIEGLICCLLSMVGCIENDKPNIEGLWCNEFNHCISLNDTLGMIDRVFASRYELKDHELILGVNADSVTRYEYKLQRDTVYLKKEGNENWRWFQKQRKINSLVVLEIDYSQESDYSKYSVKLIDEDSFIVDIEYDLRLQPGMYTGRLGEFYSGHLRALIGSMETEIDKTLSQTIISDIQEWALILKAEEGDRSLFYNYQGIGDQHENFAFFMKYLTSLVNDKGTKIERNLGVEFDSKSLLDDERKRNLKLVN